MTSTDKFGMETPALDNPDLYINRELSMLAFDRRVLEQARDPATPLLERLRFLCIANSNLDEFFEIRAAGPGAPPVVDAVHEGKAEGRDRVLLVLRPQIGCRRACRGEEPIAARRAERGARFVCPRGAMKCLRGR